ncbi:4-hydroxythreonine-4-phosphate dehydrogenase PdxA [Desulfopila sp. IMCC35008]|uniref:4-hydroxythreonine-4-phosphate dehydrogenase PdxA n=1 Tax=Desulfopila sp. IMCC35008 TaxID=2653858 RepID=UPI001F1183CC|nr:4-hydroxythreonine-4-phosphate dehydrogenase PdxA [Desulfopila sp. IMCC35008]
MGCPAGIGPEIILRYFCGSNSERPFRTVILGDIAILEKCSAELAIPARFVTWKPGTPVPRQGIPVMVLSQITDHNWGHPTTESARAMVHYIQTGVRLIQEGHLNAITTCPIAKDALQQAGFQYPGHTEMLVDLTKAEHYTMMMAGPSLRVTLATIHCRLAAVPEAISRTVVEDLIEITNRSLQMDFGIGKPAIGVAGLNPHAGESGIFGNEEHRHIEPAIRSAQDKGINVSGPYPPDTIFFKAAAGQFDCVVCMYHDQGLIPFKLLHFKDGVNVTLGLPIVRTSVDHGTAYDIAGKGVAAADSLAAAVTMAHEIQMNRKVFQETSVNI